MKKSVGPGPGAYRLPPTIGYPNHDSSRYRNPQYSIRGGKRGFESRTLGIGPVYTTNGFTEHGKLTAPAYSIKFKPRDMKTFSPPAPNAYKPEPPKVMPSYSLRSRIPPLQKSRTPGPNRYMLPTTIGPKVPDKVAGPGFSMAGKNQMWEKMRSPGPAQYGALNLNTIATRNPCYTMVGRNFMPLDSKISPGPAAYLPRDKPKGTGGYLFGLKTDVEPYITADDEMPCFSRE